MYHININSSKKTVSNSNRNSSIINNKPLYNNHNNKILFIKANNKILPIIILLKFLMSLNLNNTHNSLFKKILKILSIFHQTLSQKINNKLF